MNPVGLAIAAVVAAIAGLMIASKDFREAVFGMAKQLWEGLKPALSSVWEMIKVFGKSIWEIVKAIGDALAPAMRNLSPLVKTLGELFGANLRAGLTGPGARCPHRSRHHGVIKVIGFLLDVTTKVLVPIIEIP